VLIFLPSLDHGFIHFIHIYEWPIAVLHNARMTEVVVSSEEYRQTISPSPFTLSRHSRFRVV
jgi:hypothetical protein